MKREIYRCEARKADGNRYNDNRIAGELSSYALRCKGNRWWISIARKMAEEVVPRLPISKPEALKGKGEVAVAADRLGTDRQQQYFAKGNGRKKEEKKKKKIY